MTTALASLNLKPYLVLAAVAKATSITVGEMVSRDRSADVSRARFMAMEIFRLAFPVWSTPRTARMLQRADHGTILHGRKRAAHLLETDEHFRACFNRAVSILTTPTT